MRLTLLWVGHLSHSVVDGWNYYIRLLLKSHVLYHILDDFDGKLAILFHLILKSENDSLTETISVEILQNLKILGTRACLFEFIKRLPAEIPITLCEHVDKPIVSLLKIDVLCGVNQFTFHLTVNLNLNIFIFSPF